MQHAAGFVVHRVIEPVGSCGSMPGKSSSHVAIESDGHQKEKGEKKEMDDAVRRPIPSPVAAPLFYLRQRCVSFYGFFFLVFSFSCFFKAKISTLA